MTLYKLTFEILGGVVGWLVATFYDVIPLAVVMIAFILYDAWTAYQLDRRAKSMYPNKTKRHEAKFTSFAFGKVVRQTIPHRLAVILLAFLAEKYVFVHIHIPLSYIVTGVIIFEQAWSALENNASCRLDERESRFWKLLQNIMIDKTERHFDIELESHFFTEEQIERMRKRVADWDARKEAQG